MKPQIHTPTLTPLAPSLDTARALAQRRGPARMARAISLLGATSLLAQSGGVFSLNQSVIEGGVGTSTGGVYSIAGTVGQAATGTPSGGSFTVQSGLWAVWPTSGAPRLRISRTNENSAVVSWPTSSTGWVLQQTTTLATPPAPGVWADVSSPPVVVVGGDNTVTFIPATGTRHFRLRHP